MATKQCGFPALLLLALPLMLLAATSGAHNFGQCQVPRLDQEFCNSFYSVCLASPDKLCLAQSMSQCLGSTGFPSGILYSISSYLVEFINRMMIIIGPPQFEGSGMSPPSPSPPPPIKSKPSPPPHPPLHPTPPPRPIYWPSLPQPSKVLVPPPPPPSPPPRPIYWPLVPQQPIQPQTKPMPLPHSLNHGPIFIPGGSSIQSLPPQMGSSLITVYETGNDYLDYFISLLLSLQEKQIQNIIGVMFSDISRGEIGRGRVRSQDINVLLLKLKFLLQRYSFQEYDVNYLDTYLHHLLTSNTSLFNWFSMVLDQIYVDLKIHLPGGGSDAFPRFSLEGVFSTNVAYRQSIESCNGAPVSGVVCERYCTNNYGGNWIAIQYRERDMELPGTFDRSLNEYIRGFGDYPTGYWMGLACLSDITSRYKMELLVELADASGVTALAHYGHFRVGDQSTGHTLQLGTFLGGAAGDGLRSAEGRPFTTGDKDRDQFRNNCAVKHKGGWWYANCQQNSAKNYLNGYFSIDHNKNDLASNFPNFGVRWQTFDTTYVLVSTRMFMRRVSTTSKVGFPVYDYELVAGSHGLETFGGAMGVGEETYAVAYDDLNAGNLGGYGDTYDVSYSEGDETSIGTGADTYEYDGGDYALVYDTGAGADEGSYGMTYGSLAGGGSTGGGRGMFEMLNG